MNFNMNEVLASKWMSKDDVPQQGVDLVIRQITQETVGDEMEEKYAMHFHGSYKPLLLNRTNIRIAMSLFGPDSANWINRQVCVYADPTISFGGKLVGGVRLRMAAPPVRQPAPPPVNAHPQFDDLKDDIPF